MTMALTRRNVGVRGAVKMGANCSGSLDGTSMKGGGIEAVVAGEMDGDYRSAGMGLAASPTMAASGRRHGVVIPSPKTILKNPFADSEDNLVNCPVFFMPGLWSRKEGKDGLLSIGRTVVSSPSVDMR
ncbi:hypothetical protein VNO80_15693 [Phaseolus coccineus]|uniref:Uncharacterized protein n=1 Tax=Phaseolus coccineus TaxID=3886 RepID=A0AAN9MQR4_PHACN